MNYKILLTIFATLLLAAGCFTEDNDQPSSGAYALGEDDGAESDGIGAPGDIINVPGDYETIQAALNGAETGNTVKVAPGLYSENLTMPWGVNLEGDKIDPPVLYGTVAFNNLEDSAISYFVVDGILGDAEVGILLKNSAATVHGVTVKGFDTCVSIEGSLGLSVVRNSDIIDCATTAVNIDGIAGAQVHSNVVSNSGRGIMLSAADVSDVEVLNNTVLTTGFGAIAGAALELHTDAGYVAYNNVLVGNALGLFCLDFSCPADYNIVWGNNINYEELTFLGANDITKDPKFANWAEGDFHLMFDSPAIDAGTLDAYAPTDKDGYERPQGGGVDIGAYEYVVENKDITLAINEVMANPLNEKTGEFIEFYNYGSEAMDAADLVIDDGDSKDILTGWQEGSTLVPAGGYAVVLDPDYAGDYEIPGETVLLTVTQTVTLGSGLSNSDPVKLIDPATNLPIDSYSFPFNPGNGVSVEKDSVEEGDVNNNWKASPCGSTPGAENCASLPPNVSKEVYIAINEVMANPLDEGTGEYVELYNFADEAIDVGGFFISDGDATSVIAGWEGGSTLLLPGEFGLILDPDNAGEYDIPAETVLLAPATGSKIGSGLAVNDPITLFDESGLTVVDSYTHTFNPGNGKSVEKVDFIIGDIQSNWTTSPCGASPGAANCAYEQGMDPVTGVTLSITEVMANPLNEDTGEFVELYNYGADAVDVTGFRLSDGDAEDTIWGFEGGPAVIPAGGFAVILDSEYAGDYAIPGGATLLTTDDTTLGNGLSTTDDLSLRSDSAASVIASYNFPFNPGNGISAEKIDLVVGDVPQNWVASPCMSSPGELNCASGGEKSPFATSILIITEVMANPLSEGSGEFVELYNAGNDPVDAAGMWLTDGAGMDQLQAYGATGTIVAPGGFALILDSGYADDYELPDGITVLTTGDANLGNGLSTSDTLTLYDTDGITVVSTFSFPYNPGNGNSVEKVTMNAEDVQANWLTSSCSLDAGDANDGSSPGERNCVDPYGDVTGTNTLGQQCPNGAADCLSGLCAIDLLTWITFCTADCSVDACPDTFECVLTDDINYPFVCVPTVSMCEDECVGGEKACVDGQSYATCADFDGDGCMEWGGESLCPPWGACEEGACVQGAAPEVIINEVMYDATGADTNVFVELWGAPGQLLDGLSLVGINGNNGAVYNAIALTGVVPADGYFVVARATADAWVLDQADLLTNDVDYQNGPDSIELRWGQDEIDALGYGEFDIDEIFAGEGFAAPDVSAGDSLGRDAAHTDTDDNLADFYVCEAPTPGADNDCVVE